jgi:hypothetical protein
VEIQEIIWLEEIEDKIITKHNVWPEEAEDVLPIERLEAMEKDEGLSNISKSRSICEMAEFWDGHDATEWEDQTREVDITFDLRSRRHYIAVDSELLIRLRALAYERGLSTESLANLMLQKQVTATES